MTCARPANEYAEWSLEQIEAEAGRLVANAAAGGSPWRSLVEPLRELRDRAELIEAHVAAVVEAIG